MLKFLFQGLVSYVTPFVDMNYTQDAQHKQITDTTNSSEEIDYSKVGFSKRNRRARAAYMRRMREQQSRLHNPNYISVNYKTVVV